MTTIPDDVRYEGTHTHTFPCIFRDLVNQSRYEEENMHRAEWQTRQEERRNGGKGTERSKLG
jgi:hypothetical protein